MADYDAEVRIHTKVDTSEVDELNKALHGTASTADDTADSVNDVGDKADKTANDLKKVKEETVEITKEADKAAKAVSDMTDSSQTQSLALQIEKQETSCQVLKRRWMSLPGKRCITRITQILRKSLAGLWEHIISSQKRLRTGREANVQTAGSSCSRTLKIRK